MEAAVLEMILDARSPDPADPTVDDHELAMVDVPEPSEVPLGRAAGRQRPGGDAKLGRAHHDHLDPRSGEAVVEGLRAPLGVGALPVDDEPDGDALRGLGDQRICEPVSDEAGPEAELVDVHRRRGGGDIVEHPGVERRAFDEDIDGRGRALVEPEHERAAARRGGQDPFGLGAKAVVRNDRRARAHPEARRWVAGAPAW